MKNVWETCLCGNCRGPPFPLCHSNLQYLSHACISDVCFQASGVTLRGWVHLVIKVPKGRPWLWNCSLLPVIDDMISQAHILLPPWSEMLYHAFPSTKDGKLLKLWTQVTTSHPTLSGSVVTLMKTQLTHPLLRAYHKLQVLCVFLPTFVFSVPLYSLAIDSVKPRGIVHLFFTLSPASPLNWAHNNYSGGIQRLCYYFE